MNFNYLHSGPLAAAMRGVDRVEPLAGGGLGAVAGAVAAARATSTCAVERVACSSSRAPSTESCKVRKRASSARRRRLHSRQPKPSFSANETVVSATITVPSATSAWRP